MLPSTIWLKREALGWLPADTVILTFDDGPNLLGQTTARLLDVLEREKVPAAFCVTGHQVERAPGLARRMHAAGHLLVNHTYSHRPEILLRSTALQPDICRCDEGLGQVLGQRDYQSTWFRPPGGWITPAVRTCEAELRLRILPVTHFAFDTWCTRAGALKMVNAHVRVARRDRGGVFVIHDGLVRFRPLDRICDLLPGNDRSWVPGAVANLIGKLRAEGLRFDLPGEEPSAR
ncbi:MAG TPA: polysaccharide deacetylase family protein [Chthoniobacterales bacterium]